MRPIALVLLLLAVALAWPVPNALARATWPRRHPGPAIVLWQAVGVAGGLSIVGALAVFGLAPLGSTLPAATSRLLHGVVRGHVPDALGVADVAALIIATLLVVRLLGVLFLTAFRTERDLRRQRRAVDLVAEHGDRQLRLLHHEAPAAYCLPGTRPRIVITEGTVAALAPDELDAVLAHERAHARGRHELVVQPFVAWESALPIPAAHRATAAVTALVEMLADDSAARRTSRPALARALVAIGGTSGPGQGPGPTRHRRQPPRRKGRPRRPAGPPRSPDLDGHADPRPRPPPHQTLGTRGSRMVATACWLAAIVLVAGPTWLVFR